MSVLINRNHLVTFRLSSDEYESLKTTCTTGGARSISDFARSAVLYQLKAYNLQRVTLAEDLTTLGVDLDDLDGALRELSRRIAKVLGKCEQV